MNFPIQSHLCIVKLLAVSLTSKSPLSLCREDTRTRAGGSACYRVTTSQYYIHIVWFDLFAKSLKPLVYRRRTAAVSVTNIETSVHRLLNSVYSVLIMLKVASIYRVGQKSKLQTFVHIFAKCWPILTLFFIGTFCGKFVIKCLLNVPPHFSCVATLPCETSIFENRYHIITINTYAKKINIL